MCRLESKFFTRMDQVVLKCQNSLANPQPRTQFVAVERFGQVVIGAGIESADDILTIIFPGDQQNVLIGGPLLLANSAA